MIARKCILIFEDTVYILLDLWNSLPVASKFDDCDNTIPGNRGVIFSMSKAIPPGPLLN